MSFSPLYKKLKSSIFLFILEVNDERIFWIESLLLKFISVFLFLKIKLTFVSDIYKYIKYF